MPKFTVTLAADRAEWNAMTVEAETAEAACNEALLYDDGDYEPGDLGTSWVLTVKDAEGNELPLPPRYWEPLPAAEDLVRKIAALNASGDGEGETDPGYVHDTGDSLDTFDAVIHSARKLTGQPHDERANAFVGPSAAIPAPADSSPHAPSSSQSINPSIASTDIQHVIDEMTAVATSEDTGEPWCEWTAANKAEIDKWQSRLRDALESAPQNRTIPIPADSIPAAPSVTFQVIKIWVACTQIEDGPAMPHPFPTEAAAEKFVDEMIRADWDEVVVPNIDEDDEYPDNWRVAQDRLVRLYAEEGDRYGKWEITSHILASIPAPADLFEEAIDYYALSNGLSTVMPDGTLVHGDTD